jgi:hypothetical protein
MIVARRATAVGITRCPPESKKNLRKWVVEMDAASQAVEGRATAQRVALRLL